MKSITSWVCLGMLVALGCGKSGDGGGEATVKAVRTASGLDGSRRLLGLNDNERMEFCTAATATMFSASTADRECELVGVLSTVAFAAPSTTCEKYKADCLRDFIEGEVIRCVNRLETSTGCKASVKDGEECSFTSAMLRASLLPDLTCASDPEAVNAGASDVYSANVLDATPECERYLTCKNGPLPGDGGACDQLDKCCTSLPEAQKMQCTIIVAGARRAKGDSECEAVKGSFGCK